MAWHLKAQSNEIQAQTLDSAVLAQAGMHTHEQRQAFGLKSCPGVFPHAALDPPCMCREMIVKLDALKRGIP